ncbi:hypothetical protein LVJ85_06895 [Neisseria sp. Dent CA1/247]|uniref:hypothetical protein n=1 Tax=Neisseria TaxID=482 RepID=UPI00117E4692|nr:MULTISPECIES: hypothetical protein [Neisseria]MDO5068871.1 hypothetical protein [Neisseria zoodegmatis]UOO75793.1 hypothetical protein LVJ85_06895 [Neisseria sp. Dent CA1/247]
MDKSAFVYKRLLCKLGGDLTATDYKPKEARGRLKKLIATATTSELYKQTLKQQKFQYLLL